MSNRLQQNYLQLFIINVGDSLRPMDTQTGRRWPTLYEVLTSGKDKNQSHVQ